ncbi:MAG: aminomethyl transferase family protein [Myxococcaceae bacterium]|nr:MAG: aminomethyl transferase family protein [Myxococcaceae bacterium]
MIADDEVRAIRTGVALSVDEGVVALRVAGEDAFRAVDRALPTDLHLRDGQARQSLLLDAAGRPIADVLVARDDEDYLLIVDGVPAERALAHLRELGGASDARALDVTSVSVHGPWAWELMAEVFEAGVAAVPYLSLLRVDGELCVRAGRTGEFGYEILCPRERAAELAARLADRGARYGIARVSRAALTHCAFENWFYDPSFAPPGATAVELQLQWRLSSRKEYLGREAIAARRRDEGRERIACLVTDELLLPGDEVVCDGEPIGRVTHAERSLTRGDFIAQALLGARWAHGGIDRYRVRRGGREVAARTVTPPLVDNRSLYVDPRRHSFECADEVSFPPIARGGTGVAGGA